MRSGHWRVRIFTTLFLLVFAQGVSAQSDSADSARSSRTIIHLPTRYSAARFYLAPVTERGDTLLFYTDTGGGSNMIYASAVERLGLATEWLMRGDDSVRVVAFPTLELDAAIPAPTLLPPIGPRLLVMDESLFNATGFLGRTWFAGRVWAFDYPQRSLGLVIGYDQRATPSEHRVRLYFQMDSSGQRTTHFPRIRIEVDGDSLDLLFDTGATVRLTENALARRVEDGPAARGTSFIAESVFEGWRNRHPDWRVIENADQTLDMPIIRVPEISVGGYTVGPVWFTMRPDESFYEYMSQWMDRPVDGALGGSALRYFRVIVDYPNAVALFERP